MEDAPTGSITVPRVGFETGEHVKWRTAAELPMVRDDMEKVTNFVVTTGFGYGW